MAEKAPTAQIIPKPGVSEHAQDNPDMKTNTGEHNNASATLFDAAGAVSTSPPTESATMPQPADMPEKRGRGRPRKDGSAPEKSNLKTKASAGKTADAKATEGEAAALMAVGVLDMARKIISGGECPANPEVRAATVEAWREYIAENNYVVPAWLQVAIISSVYVAPAFTTESGKGKVSGAWAKIKGWYIARRG